MSRVSLRLLTQSARDPAALSAKSALGQWPGQTGGVIALDDMVGDARFELATPAV